MSDTQISVDLDPKKVMNALEDMAKEVKALSEKLEQSLGKDGPKSVKKFEEAAEKGSTKIATYFRNLGKTLKEDMKTAFDVGKLAGGLKIGSLLAEGTKQVFDMERAFDRYNGGNSAQGEANGAAAGYGKKGVAIYQSLYGSALVS